MTEADTGEMLFEDGGRGHELRNTGGPKKVKKTSKAE